MPWHTTWSHLNFYGDIIMFARHSYDVDLSNTCCISSLNYQPEFLAPRAFTLVELLVVTSIVGTLVALLLPAVQSAREAARRMSCANNLKQIGIGLHLHHDAKGRLPMGWHGQNVTTGLPDPLGEPGWGWASAVLPFLDQGSVSDNLIHDNLSITASENEQARTWVIRSFCCPSDTGSDIFTWVPDRTPTSGWVNPQLATANYVGVFGTTDIHKCGSLPPGTQCVSDGVFFHNSGVRFSDITDGLSNTFMVGERTSNLGYSTWVGAPAGDECAPGLVLGSASYPPNSRQTDVHNFSSNHPAGANFLLGDGSVRMISQGIDEATYHALCTRAGNETIDISKLNE